MSTGLGWGEAKGGAEKSEVTYMKFKTGDNQIRIVSGVLARYDYWVSNNEGKSVPFENLSFDRMKEKFIKGAEDPVSELGLTEKDPENKGQYRKMRSRRGYKCMVINRATGKLEAMDLKKSIFDGIIATMQELEIEDPTSIDFVIKRSGEQWWEVKYEINQIRTMKLKEQAAELHKDDDEIIATMKPLDQLFPRQTPAEQRQALQAWMSGTRANKDSDDGASDSGADEAISELDD